MHEDYYPEEEQKILLEKRRNWRKERRRQVQKMKKRMAAGIVLFFVVVAGIVGNWSRLTGKKTKIQQEITGMPVNGEGTAAENFYMTGTEKVLIDESITGDRREYLEAIVKLAESDERYLEVLENQEEFPDGVLRLCANNEEALDFVLNYPKKKEQAAVSSVGEVTLGEVPLLIQWDEKWGYAPYGDETIVGVSGCGPTCMAMVICALTGRTDVTPAVVAKYSANNGFLTNTNDTSWDLMNYGGEAYGIYGRMIGLDENVMANELYAGHPIIASMGPGDFTSVGHLLVISGYDGKAFEIKDPNSVLKSERTWTFEELQGQIKNLWAFQLM